MVLVLLCILLAVFTQQPLDGMSREREVAAQRETKYCTMLSRLLDHEIVINFHHLLKDECLKYFSISQSFISCNFLRCEFREKIEKEKQFISRCAATSRSLNIPTVEIQSNTGKFETRTFAEKPTRCLCKITEDYLNFLKECTCKFESRKFEHFVEKNNTIFSKPRVGDCRLNNI